MGGWLVTLAHVTRPCGIRRGWLGFRTHVRLAWWSPVSVHDRLVAVCGGRHVRTAGPADAVAAVPSQWVVAPGSADEVAGVVAVAADEGLTLVARGSGSKLDWGGPPSRLDLIVDLGRLAGVHRATAPGG